MVRAVEIILALLGLNAVPVGAQKSPFDAELGKLIDLLSGIVRNVACIPGTQDDSATFEIITTPNATQQRAFDLLETIRV